jgi:hypothetical protein
MIVAVASTLAGAAAFSDGLRKIPHGHPQDEPASQEARTRELREKRSNRELTWSAPSGQSAAKLPISWSYP